MTTEAATKLYAGRDRLANITDCTVFILTGQSVVVLRLAFVAPTFCLALLPVLTLRLAGAVEATSFWFWLGDGLLSAQVPV